MVYYLYMGEIVKKMKETDKREHKFKHINLWLIPEIANNSEEISYYFVREYLRELLNSPHLILSVSRETADEFFNTNGYIIKQIHSNRELHEKWKPLSLGAKKRLYYLVNKKLLEVLNDELQTTRPPS